MKQHPADAMAEDLERAINDLADHLAERFLGSPLSPPTAPMPEAEKLRYFAAQFFNPDGTPNAEGRGAVMQKYGPRTFEQIATALAKQHARLHEDATGEPLPEPDTSVPVVSPMAQMAPVMVGG